MRIQLTVHDIDPEAWYYTDYSIDNEGNKIYTTAAIQGKDLTENQIRTAELID
jgi:hypothetical protein